MGTALANALSLHFPVCLLVAPFLWKNPEGPRDSPNLSPRPVPTGRSLETLITCIGPASRGSQAGPAPSVATSGPRALSSGERTGPRGHRATTLTVPFSVTDATSGLSSSGEAE